ncbi:MAG: hypothetical protein PF487_03225 [Bacteroidales bacterium]|jgi:hypothetical protein|nr:hypothetical protein [Bacteroidales bacterium]
MKFKLDSILLGSILGIIIPIITIFLVYFIKFPQFELIELLNYLIVADTFAKLASLCVIPNAVLFFIFIYRNILLSARGVLMATMIYAVLIFIAKFAL